METLSISVPMSAAGVSLLNAASAQLASLVGGKVAPVAAAPVAAVAAPPAKGKPGRKSKAQKAAEAAQQGATAATDDLSDLDMSDNEDDGLGLDDLDTPAAVTLTLAGDVIPAFRAALERVAGDKTKLAKVLEGYGVKSVQLLPEAKFAEVIAKLAKLK